MKSKSPPPSLLRRLVNIDTALSLHLHDFTQPFLPRSFLKALEISGDGRLFFPIVISLYLSPLFTSTSISPHLRTFLADLIVGGLLDIILIGIIKPIVRRPRPVYNKHMFLTFAVDHWSFPSGHSSRVCFVASFIYLSSSLIETFLVELRSFETEYAKKVSDLLGSDQVMAVRYIVLFVCVWALLTSVSRILLGRHFVFDVFAGVCLGMINALLVFHYVNYSTLSSIWTR